MSLMQDAMPPRIPRLSLPPMSPFAARLWIIAAALAVWEIAARFFVDQMFLAPPSGVAMALPGVLATPGVAEALIRCLYELAVAFAISVVGGFVLGVLIGIPRFAYLALMPLVILLYALPQSTLLPVFTMVFGIGPAGKIAFGATHGIFPVLVTVIAAVQRLKPQLMTAARAMGASRMQVIWHVVVPSITPAFFTGLRLGMASTVIGVLLAELYISQQGIGYFTRKFSLDFDPSSLFALIILISVLAVAINEAIRRLELRFGRWRA